MSWKTVWIVVAAKLISAESSCLENLKAYVAYKTYYVQVTEPMAAAYREFKRKVRTT